MALRRAQTLIATKAGINIISTKVLDEGFTVETYIKLVNDDEKEVDEQWEPNLETEMEEDGITPVMPPEIFAAIAIVADWQRDRVTNDAVPE